MLYLFFLRKNKLSLSYFWGKFVHACNHPHTLPHIELQDRAKEVYFFPLCSTSLPFFSVVMKNTLLCTVQWCGVSLFPLKAEDTTRCGVVAHPVNLKLSLKADILICHDIWTDMPGKEGGMTVVPFGPIISVAVPVLSSCNSTALSASCHHPKLARRPSAVEKSYCCQVFVFASSRNMFLKEVQWTVPENGWISGDRNKNWYKVISIKALKPG